MATGKALILDHDPKRCARVSEWLRASQTIVIEASSADVAIPLAQNEKPDLVLFRFGPDAGIPAFKIMVAEFHDAFVIPFIERSFSEKFRGEVLALNASGFLNEDLPKDELIAAIRALLRQKRALKERDSNASPKSSHAFNQHGRLEQKTNLDYKENGAAIPLRERAPEVYKAVLSRYEEGIKRVLQNRIYKIDDDVFEPFRLIAKELFLANATARDAVELHYQTLRKIAPTPDTPRAQGYLEVGRTTIIGLMGDLLTYYRDTRGTGFFDESNTAPQPQADCAHT